MQKKLASAESGNKLVLVLEEGEIKYFELYIQNMCGTRLQATANKFISPQKKVNKNAKSLRNFYLHVFR